MGDISAIRVVERKIEMLDPQDGSKLGISVTLMSVDDDRYKTAKRTVQDRSLYLDARGKHFKAEEIDEQKNFLVFSAITGWDFYDPEASFHGEKPEFNKVNAYKIFKELPWFRDQLDEELNEKKSFLSKLETT